MDRLRLPINPSAAGKFVLILPLSQLLISGVGQKKKNVNVKNSQASFLFNYSHFLPQC